MERLTMTDESEQLMLSEAAAELGISATTLRVAAHHKRLVTVLHGKFHFVTRAELERYRRAQLGRPGPKGPRTQKKAEEP